MDHRVRSRKDLILAISVATAISASLAPVRSQNNSPVPRMWDDAAMSRLEVPLSHAAFSPRHVTADYYYQIPVRPIFRSYPVYAPGREPAGYFESLLQKEPEEIRIDADAVKNDGEWARLGEIVFQAPTFYDCCIVRPAGR